MNMQQRHSFPKRFFAAAWCLGRQLRAGANALFFLQAMKPVPVRSESPCARRPRFDRYP